MTDNRPVITEAEFERRADAEVMRRLGVDPRYRNAASAESQSQAEEAITQEVCRDLDANYAVS